MKYLKQFSIILFISLLGEILHSIVPLPMPASIYGLAILFTALSTGIIPLEEVRETGRFLIEVMPLMFIPAGSRTARSISYINAGAGAICSDHACEYTACDAGSRQGNAGDERRGADQ